MAGMSADRPDIVILGGGLAGGLIALALAEQRPDLKLLLVERGESLGGNHLWSFFASDIAAQHRWLVDPLVVAEWPDYEVAFPGHRRRLSTGYASVTSRRLDQRLREVLPADAILTGAQVVWCGSDHALLAGGRRIEAAVIDARGVHLDGEVCGGWQKFLGQRLVLESPHGLDRPLVMDATVPQVDGYRFVYVLPLGDSEVFVEDTYYSDDSRLQPPVLRARIAEYVARHGWTVAETLSEEAGVLPVVTGGDFDRFWNATGESSAKAGTRAGLFHPLTSYSLPIAVRFAAALAELGDLSPRALAGFSHDHARRHWARGWFDRRLGAMLFGAARPGERYKVLERFYRLPQPAIERFYAGQSSWSDRLRTVAGKPPVPLGRALRVLAGAGGAPGPLRQTPPHEGTSR